jgi:hypothetical protein
VSLIYSSAIRLVSFISEQTDSIVSQEYSYTVGSCCAVEPYAD